MAHHLLSSSFSRFLKRACSELESGGHGFQAGGGIFFTAVRKVIFALHLCCLQRLHLQNFSDELCDFGLATWTSAALVLFLCTTIKGTFGYELEPSTLILQKIGAQPHKRNLAWQQKELREFCNAKGIVLTAVSPLRKGASRGPNEVMENDMLKEIVEAHGKSIAQVSLRWLYEQGVTFVAKSYDKDIMNQNLQIFDWALTKEDLEKIDQIKQNRLIPGPTKPQLNDLFDDQA